MQVERVSYTIPINHLKKNGETLSQKDLIDIGYMSGRYGINLDGNLQENNQPEIKDGKLNININSCTAKLFETNMQNKGIAFNKVV